VNSRIFRSYLLAGLAVWLPILVTMLVLRFIIDILDSFIPLAYQPERIFGHAIPGIGVLFSLVLLLITGMIATNYIGQRLVIWNDALFSRIPLVRSIYTTAKQVINALFSTNSESFRKVVLLEYPRKGLWSIAFLTGGSNERINEQIEQDVVSVFIPTTPNPTSGFLLLVPKSDVIELEMGVDEALKYIISLGVMQTGAATNTPGNSFKQNK